MSNQGLSYGLYAKRLLLSCISLPLSIAILLIFRYSSFTNSKKFFIYVCTPRYFGHLALNAAIASSFSAQNNCVVYFVLKGRDTLSRSILVNIAKNSLHGCPSVLLHLLVFALNNSFYFIRVKLSNYYDILMHNDSYDREFAFFNLLQTEKKFPWRSIVNEYFNLGNLQAKKTIIIAPRTQHFHGNNPHVLPQPWRNLCPVEIIHIIKAAFMYASSYSILLYSSRPIYDIILALEPKISGMISFADENQIDFLDLAHRCRLLINNGNGLSAFAYAAGISTLYIKHSPWHVWATSHSNSVIVPFGYTKNVSNEINPLEMNLEKVKNALVTCEPLPLNYEQHFRSRGLVLDSVNAFSIPVLSSYIGQALAINDQSYKTYERDSLHLRYRNEYELYFWVKYYEYLPIGSKYHHNLITASIAFSGNEIFAQD